MLLQPPLPAAAEIPASPSRTTTQDQLRYKNDFSTTVIKLHGIIKPEMWFGSPKGTKAEHVPEHVGKKGVFPASKVQDPSWIKRW